MSEKTGMRKNWPRQLPANARLMASPLRFSNQLPMMRAEDRDRDPSEPGRAQHSVVQEELPQRIHSRHERVAGREEEGRPGYHPLGPVAVVQAAGDDGRHRVHGHVEEDGRRYRAAAPPELVRHRLHHHADDGAAPGVQEQDDERGGEHVPAVEEAGCAAGGRRESWPGRRPAGGVRSLRVITACYRNCPGR